MTLTHRIYRPCRTSGCAERGTYRGYCWPHYNHAYNRGTIDRDTPPTPHAMLPTGAAATWFWLQGTMPLTAFAAPALPPVTRPWQLED